MDFFHVRSFGHIEIWSNQTMLKYTASANSSFIADYAVFDDDATKNKRENMLNLLYETHSVGWPKLTLLR